MWNTQKVWERASLKLVVVCAVFLTALAAKAQQQTTGTPGLAERHHHDRRQISPCTAATVWRLNLTECSAVQAGLACANRATEECTEHPAHL